MCKSWQEMNMQRKFQCWKINVEILKFPCGLVFLCILFPCAIIDSSRDVLPMKSRENLISMGKMMGIMVMGVKMFFNRSSVKRYAMNHQVKLSANCFNINSIFFCYFSPLCLSLLSSNYNGNFLRDYHWVSFTNFLYAPARVYL